MTEGRTPLAIAAAFAALACLGYGIARAGDTTPKPPASLCIEGPTVACAPTTPPAGVKRKWHPGHYKFNQYQQTATNVVPNSFYTDLANEPAAVQGVMQPFAWASIETAKDEYDFSRIDQKLALLKGMNKRLIIYLRTRSCCTRGQNGNGYVPDYIINEYGGMSYSYGTAAKLWEQPTMDRVIKLYKALAARYDNEPAFEAVATDETAIQTPGSNFSRDALRVQYSRLIAAWSAAAPRTTLFVFANYIGDPSTTLKSLMDTARDNKMGIGGPDIAPPRPVDSYSVVQGLVGNHDYRGEVPQLYIGTAYLKLLNGGTAQQSYDFARDTLKAEYIAWKVHLDGTPQQNWKTGVIPVIEAHPTTYTACPRIFGPGGCDSSN